MIEKIASAGDHSLRGRDLGGEAHTPSASSPLSMQITAARYPEISRRCGGRDRPGFLERPLPYRVTHTAGPDPIGGEAMADISKKTDADWELDDLAEHHAIVILKSVMHRHNYAGETLVQLTHALRHFEHKANEIRVDVAKRVEKERLRKAKKKGGE